MITTTDIRPSLLNRLDWRDYAIYIGFVVVFGLFAIFLAGDGFLTGTNLLNIFRQTAIISIMAVAMTFVIAAAQIDLSVGSVAGLASVVAAIAIAGTGSTWLGVLAGLGVGVIIGAVNGGLVTFLGMPSFLVTLAMLGIAFGLAQFITTSAPVPILDDTFNAIFGGGNIGPVPGLLVWTVIAVAIGAVVLAKTRYGRQVLATGGNRVAAEYSGVNTKRITFTVMLVSSVVAAVAGMLYAGRLESGRYQWGTGDELSVIAAVILGGTSLFGGAGSIIGALFGSLLIGLINNGLILAGLDNSQQQIIRGLIIIVAVALARKK
ncbi:ABC transporter permease [Pseudonocardia petroleophila]|uniref:ABC transporter permease n=1 Tax=Pseudonocardia petroleophila TaxID=37331 RepID=A0A7G7MCM2_9PSEU|nr:ABC transporter permease [Pseudonocardia petroleophila]QNG50533.1 ABC transporter permease [Pseudonocardia petroleophila]